MLKDDKSYPFIKVTIGEEFPRVLFSRTMKHGTGKFFGPYTSAGAVKETIELLCKLYKGRTCNRRLPKDIGKDRPCLNYHIGQCNAPCQGYVNKDEYKKNVYKDDFFGRKVGLTVSGQLEAEAMACSLGKVYTFGPTFRAENSNTKTHVSEFWMIEPEIAFCDLNMDMDIMEDMLDVEILV